MSDLWSEAARDLDGEERESLHVQAVSAMRDEVWPYLAEAQSGREYGHRLAMVADKLDAIAQRVGGARADDVRQHLASVIEADADDLLGIRRAAGHDDLVDKVADGFGVPAGLIDPKEAMSAVAFPVDEQTPFICKECHQGYWMMPSGGCTNCGGVVVPWAEDVWAMEHSRAASAAPTGDRIAYLAPHGAAIAAAARLAGMDEFGAGNPFGGSGGGAGEKPMGAGIEKALPDEPATGTPDWVMNTAEGARRTAASDAARELCLFIENDGDLYRQMVTPIIDNLARKKAKGTYDSTLALKAWKNLADEGAKRYHAQFGSGGPWHGMFSPDDRRECAAMLADSFGEELDGRNAARTAAKPQCRYCGAKVEYMGDICKDCDNGQDPADDGLAQITRDDTHRLQGSRTAGYWGADGATWGDQPADVLDDALEDLYGDFDSYFGKVTVDEAWADPKVQEALAAAAAAFQRDMGRAPTEGELRGGLAFSLGQPGANGLPLLDARRRAARSARQSRAARHGNPVSQGARHRRIAGDNRCPKCGGSGNANTVTGDTRECPACDGSGRKDQDYDIKGNWDGPMKGEGPYDQGSGYWDQHEARRRTAQVTSWHAPDGGNIGWSSHFRLGNPDEIHTEGDAYADPWHPTGPTSTMWPVLYHAGEDGWIPADWIEDPSQFDATCARLYADGDWDMRGRGQHSEGARRTAGWMRSDRGVTGNPVLEPYWVNRMPGSGNVAYVYMEGGQYVPGTTLAGGEPTDVGPAFPTLRDAQEAADYAMEFWRNASRTASGWKSYPVENPSASGSGDTMFVLETDDGWIEVNEVLSGAMSAAPGGRWAWSQFQGSGTYVKGLGGYPTAEAAKAAAETVAAQGAHSPLVGSRRTATAWPCSICGKAATHILYEDGFRASGRLLCPDHASLDYGNPNSSGDNILEPISDQRVGSRRTAAEAGGPDTCPVCNGTGTYENGGECQGCYGEGTAECLRKGGPTPCSGPLVWRVSDSGLSTIVECQKHQNESEARNEKSRRDYPDSPNAPSWFDPDAAGERWDDDY